MYLGALRLVSVCDVGQGTIFGQRDGVLRFLSFDSSSTTSTVSRPCLLQAPEVGI
jgi:hypothetical protein